jgi:hypothetical protein
MNKIVPLLFLFELSAALNFSFNNLSLSPAIGE